MYYLFLDDERDPLDVTWVNLPLYNWTIVRNYREFVSHIEKNGLPKFVTFDHDLAIEHYPFMEPTATALKADCIPYEIYKEKTGYDCAKWLVEYCMENRKFLPEYAIHTKNPVGAENIRCLFRNFQKFQAREAANSRLVSK